MDEFSAADDVVAGLSRREQDDEGISPLAALRGAGNALSGGVQTFAKNTDQLFYHFFNGNLPGTTRERQAGRFPISGLL